jgi:hypothetical protein
MNPMLFLLAAQAVVGAPPVVSGANLHRPLAAFALSCTLSRWSDRPFELSAQLPAVPLDQQHDGMAYGLQARLASADVKSLTGSFPANLTFSIGDVARYSVITRDGAGATRILQFEIFPDSGQGFLTIAAFGSSGFPAAYAAGLCTLKSSDRRPS